MSHFQFPPFERPLEGPVRKAGESMGSRCTANLFAFLLIAISVQSGLHGEGVPAVPPNESRASEAKPNQDSSSSGVSLQDSVVLDSRKWSVFTQATYIDQGHYGFRSAYEGPNSLSRKREVEHTLSYTFYLDRALWQGGEVVYNPEIFQGHGLSQTLGVAGFPNGEAVKSGFAHLHYNTSRLFLRHIFQLGGQKEKIERDLNQLPQGLDISRITLSVGKFSANDFFDGNTYAHDPRTQFMNWSMWESTAWDYPADIVGFTAGAVVEWNTKNTTMRYGLFMEPDRPNGPTLDKHPGKAHGQILQFDYRYLLGALSGTVRPFIYWNQALMGDWKLATEGASGGGSADVSLTRRYRSKVGLGASWDQELTGDLGLFARISWNDGRTESWAFTQVDRSVAAGVSLKGNRWNRPDDVLGIGVAADAISGVQMRYLAAGGIGLIIGDGSLSYRTERILETYYAYQALKWLQLSVDYQYISNPGYNSARGPVSFYAVRGHIQF